MKNRNTGILAIVLVIAAGTCFRILTGSSVRSVEFLSIFVFGFMSGMLVMHLLRNRKKN
ncbi:MAG TPA: hypothetical protein PLQ93_08170 [Bacteroidia bacterium]|nr:hypothetical protein [Bacteroidia bacterium]